MHADHCVTVSKTQTVYVSTAQPVHRTLQLTHLANTHPVANGVPQYMLAQLAQD